MDSSQKETLDQKKFSISAGIKIPKMMLGADILGEASYERNDDKSSNRNKLSFTMYSTFKSVRPHNLPQHFAEQSFLNVLYFEMVRKSVDLNGHSANEVQISQAFAAGDAYSQVSRVAL